MSERSDGLSLREHTAAIRHLDAARARELIALFTRPVAATEPDLGYDAADPITAATHGHLALDHATAAVHSPAVVGHYQTHLYLHGLLRLPPSVARELARHHGHLYLDALRSITDTAAAALAAHPAGGLSLNGLRRLSAAAARALGRHRGELSFDRLPRLDAAAAIGLAPHANDLHLGGLRSLVPQAAAPLAQHRGDLYLDKLACPPARVATHLARHAGRLHLHGVSRLSNAAARAFGGRTGHLCLRNLRRLTPLQAKLLAGHTGELQLDAIELDDITAVLLGRHTGSLVLRVPDDLPISHLAFLARHRGPLELSGLRRLDAQRAEVLAAQPAPGGHKGLTGLFLPAVTELAPPVAAILATHDAGGLALNGLTRLDEDVARVLVKHPLLALDCVTTLTDRVAAILATHTGTLSLRGLREVSGRALAALQENPGIELPSRLRERPATSSAVTAARTTRATPDQLVAAIERIAHRGEEALRN
jgi:hypothetical protein